MKKPIFKTIEKALDTRQCFDCATKIEIEGDDLKNGSILLYEDNKEKFFVIKCDDCYSKNPGISGYKECEVYSRIVGYLRPVQNWNDGKKREYEERATFNY